MFEAHFLWITGMMVGVEWISAADLDDAEDGGSYFIMDLFILRIMLRFD